MTDLEIMTAQYVEEGYSELLAECTTGDCFAWVLPFSRKRIMM